MAQAPETDLEKAHGFNALTSWLHSHRYHHLLRLTGALRQRHPNRRLRVVEVGCAHGRLFEVLSARFPIDYTGIDIDATFVATARARYAHEPHFQVVQAAAEDATELYQGADLLVALETFEHIPEHRVVRIVEAMGAAKPRRFVCSVPVEVGPAVWLKNVGSWATGYYRHREYQWSETFWAGLYQLDRLPPHETGHRGFDWRWLAQTIRHNLRIRRILSLPLPFLPTCLAFSVFIEAESRPPQAED